MRKMFFLVLTVQILLNNILVKAEELKSNINPQTEIPLIEREAFFDNPEISNGRLSPDGKSVTFVKPYKNMANIWIKDIDASFDDARPVTADSKRAVKNYFWSHDSKYIFYLQDKDGDENYQIFAVNPEDQADKELNVPPARNLINKDGVKAYIYKVSRKKPNILWIGLNDRDKAWHDLYELDADSGKLTLLYKNTERITGWYFDWNEKLRLAERTKSDGNSVILRIDGKKTKKIYECGPLESCRITGFDSKNREFYMATNKGADNNFVKLVLFNPRTLTETFVESDPEKKVDFYRMMFSDITKSPVATFYNDAKVRVYWKDRDYESIYNFLKSKFPGMQFMFPSTDKTETVFMIYVSSDTDHGTVYLYNRITNELKFQYRLRPKLPPEHLSPMVPVTYKSSDSLEIPGYLTLPKGREAKNLPLIVMPHGGPWSRDIWGFNSFAQFFSNRGYAVLQMNFRGSTGFGKAYLDAGNRQWGDKMQDDITYGVKYLTEQGIADPERIGIFGISYGGYAAFAGVAFTPDLYKAAVAVVAPSSLFTLISTIPSYWEAGRKNMYLRVGDPTTPEGKDQLERQSPLNHVKKIRTPLIIVQGANDPRVKKSEADQIVAAMRDNKIPVEYLLAKDEGHQFNKPENIMAYIALAEKFFAKHLGGRYQESIAEKAQIKLKEMTVDINTVVKP